MHLTLLGSALHAADTLTNCLSLHLVSGHISRQSLIDGSASVKNCKLRPEPLLADRDFVSYDRINHGFTITAEAGRRLSTRLTGKSKPTIRKDRESVFLLDVTDVPCVLVAKGKPIYLAVFSSFTSSTIYSVPVIYFQTASISEKNTNNLNLLISMEMMRKNSAKQHQLDILYDSQILAALKELGLNHK